MIPYIKGYSYNPAIDGVFQIRSTPLPGCTSRLASAAWLLRGGGKPVGGGGKEVGDELHQKLPPTAFGATSTVNASIHRPAFSQVAGCGMN